MNKLLACPLLIVALALPAPARGADVFVAGTIGEVYQGDADTGEFTFFGGICLAPVHALAFDNDFVYAGDSNGGILRLDAESGKFIDLYWIPSSDATDLLSHRGDLLVSTSAGRVDRVDPTTGAVEASLASPIQVLAMALDGDDLYVAGPVGFVYKGSAYTGNFQPFGGACLGPIRAMAVDDTSLYAGDETGAVLVFSLATGENTGTFFTPASVTGLVVDGGDLLVSEVFGTIRRLDPADGSVLETIVSPIFVDAMDILPVFGDLDGDGVVGVTDFLQLLAEWGPCPAPPGQCPADLDGNGAVDTVDFLLLLAEWT